MDKLWLVVLFETVEYLRMEGAVGKEEWQLQQVDDQPGSEGSRWHITQELLLEGQSKAPTHTD